MRKLREILRLHLELEMSARAIARSCSLSPDWARVHLELRKKHVTKQLLNLGYKAPQAKKAAELAGDPLGPEAAFLALFNFGTKSVLGGPNPERIEGMGAL